jgi:peptide/nickel transport system ATP-binding protein
VLLDEPVTSLDVSIRGSILNLLRDRAKELNTTFVVVSHDLAAIYHLADELHIMYREELSRAAPRRT